MVDLSPTKILYHYTTSENIDSILVSGSILPSVVGAYLSVNMSGVFDVQSRLKRPGWLSGFSRIPNIFLTDTIPENIKLEHFGSVGTDYAIWMTIEDILAQDLKLYRNPSAEFPNMYNIPCPNLSTRLTIDVKKIITVKNK